MNAAAIVERLEGAEMRAGAALPVARAALARRIGVSPGTLESIRRGRVKRIAHDIFCKLHSAMERQLEKEIEAATHELAILRAAGPRVDEAALGEAVDAVARARAAIERARK